VRSFLSLLASGAGRMTSQEIIDFMLGKKGVSSSGGGGVDKKAATSSWSSPPLSSPRLQSPNNNRKAQLVATAFAKTLVKVWIETDDTLYQVVRSIANLRDRLWQTSQSLSKLKEHEEPAAWKTFGYRDCGGGMMLNEDDLQLTLDHDLRQHERMMATLRRCLSALNQAQEALGRRLDEYYQLMIEVSSGRPSILSLEECQSLFAATSSELYRKQVMAEAVLGSVENALLFRDDASKGPAFDSANGRNPRRVAHRCSDQWSRQHKDSKLREFSTVLDNLQERTVGGN